jgi:membrane protein
MNDWPTALRGAVRVRLIPAARGTAAYVLYAVRRFYRDRGLQAAGALTYTTLLALVPLLTIAFAIFSAFPAFQAVKDRIEILLFENLVPEVGLVVREHLTEFIRNASNLTAVGVVALAVSAVLLLSTVESVFNTIWRVERDRPVITRLLIFWTVLTLGPVLLGASFSLTTGAFDWIGELADQGAAYVPIAIDSPGLGFVGGRIMAAGLQTVAFTVLFMLVPARPVLLRDALVGGAVAGVALEVLKWAFRVYLVSFPSYQTIYGALATFPIFLIWMYLSWTVVLIGAVFAASFTEWRASRVRRIDLRLDPPRRLEAACVLLAVLAERARTGGATTPETLARALPIDERDSLMETLRVHGYLVATDEGGYALARDLHVVTLAQLARDLGLTLGLDGSPAGSAADRRAARRLDAASGRLAERLGDLFQAEERALGLTLAEALEDTGRGGPDSEVIALAPGTPQAPRP